MGTRPVNVVIDAARPGELARFWSDLLGWPIAVDEPDGVGVRAPSGDGCELDLTLVPVQKVKEVKNRIHLDLASATLAHQQELVARAMELGGKQIDIGQGAVPWVVLADPEGNEFCVLEPREQYARTGALAAIVVDAHDPEALAGFWSDALAWPIENRGPGLFAGLRPPRGGPWLEFVQNKDVKSGKNRVRIGVGAHSGLRNDAELARLIEVGATPADLEAPERSWRLLADPEGNEFHVHRMR